MLRKHKFMNKEKSFKLGYYTSRGKFLDPSFTKITDSYFWFWNQQVLTLEIVKTAGPAEARKNVVLVFELKEDMPHYRNSELSDMYLVYEATNCNETAAWKLSFSVFNRCNPFISCSHICIIDWAKWNILIHEWSIRHMDWKNPYSLKLKKKKNPEVSTWNITAHVCAFQCSIWGILHADKLCPYHVKDVQSDIAAD